MNEAIESILTTDVFTTIIPVLGSIFMASLTYYLTKKKERENVWQKEKLNFYVEFISSITDDLECGNNTIEGEKRYARASNNLYLFANTKVISALKDYQDEISISNNDRTVDAEARALGNLIFQMREDLKIKDNKKKAFNSIRFSGFGGAKTQNSSKKETKE